VTESEASSKLSELPEATAHALVAGMLLASGYVVGYLHGTAAYQHSAFDFMLGVAMASGFAVPALYIAKRGDGS
jgi:hypothetical protein